MITIPFNKNINGDSLVQEFANAGFTTDVVVYPGNLLELNGLNEADALIANQILDAHIVPAPTEPTVAEKLASVGLSLEELRTALGSN
jgi:hypothetical protein